MSVWMQVSKKEESDATTRFCGQEVFLKEYHKGLVVDLKERNWHDDSDFIAVIWDAEKKAPFEIEYATTRAWTYANGAQVDASPEVMAEYQAHLARLAEASRKAAEEARMKDPVQGKRVKVVGGRKHLGKEGVIFWRGVNQFRTYYRNGYNRPEAPHNQRVGILMESGEKFFVPLPQVEVILENK